MHPPTFNGGLKGIRHTYLSQKQVFLGSTPRAATKFIIMGTLANGRRHLKRM